MKAIGERIERNVVDLRGHVMDVIQQHIIAGTPVSPVSSGHSGRARGNWYISVDQPYTVADYDGPFDPTGSFRMESNTAVLLSTTNVKASFFLTNNLDYIDELNNGGSMQAPANFVRLSVMEGISEIKEARLLDG